MKVKELIAMLETANPESKIVIAQSYSDIAWTPKTVSMREHGITNYFGPDSAAHVIIVNNQIGRIND